MSMENSKLSDYINKDNIEEKPVNDGKPWSKVHTNILLRDATSDYEKFGEPNIKLYASQFGRSEGAIMVKLSKEGWNKTHPRVPKTKIMEGTLKRKVLDYIREHPYCFLRDIDKALKASSSSTLSALYKEGTVKRTRHGGNENYLYCISEIPITIEKASAEILEELEPKTSKNPIIRIGKFLSDLIKWR